LLKMAARHVFLILADLLSVFLFSGIIFGWAPLNEILIKEGFYHELCPPGSTEPCQEQRTALNRAFTLATTAVSIAALPGGSFVDACGPMVGVMVAGLLNIVGLIGIAMCQQIGSIHFDVFLVSFVVVAVGGSLTMFCGYSLPFLFPRRCTLLIELTSCLFDASCIIFPIFKVFYDMGVEFKNLFWFYVGLCVLNYVLLVAAWAMNRQKLHRSRAGGHNNGEDCDVLAPNLQGKPLKNQFLSLEFVVILVFASIQVTRSNLYLGVVDLVDYQIATKTDAIDKASQMTTIVGLIIPQGWLAVPLIEMCVHRLGIYGTLQVTTLIGLVYNGLQLIPNLIVQVLGAAVFALFRAFLFSIITAFNAETFGPKTLGRIMGVCFLVSAIVNLSQNPLVQMSLTQLDSNFVPLLLGSLIVCLPMPLLVCLAQARRPPSARERSEDTLHSGQITRTRSRTLSHSTACCTAAHFNIATEIERTLLENEPSQQQLQVT